MSQCQHSQKMPLLAALHSLQGSAGPGWVLVLWFNLCPVCWARTALCSSIAKPEVSFSRCAVPWWLHFKLGHDGSSCSLTEGRGHSEVWREEMKALPVSPFLCPGHVFLRVPSHRWEWRT